MQISIQFQSSDPLIIPYNYNYQLQSALYALLGEVGESDFWHDKGFRYYDSSFKGFCFGKLEGDYRTYPEEKKIGFEDKISLEVRSISFHFIDALQRALEKHPYIRLFDTRLDVIGASLMNRHLDREKLIVQAVTPMMIHTTYEDGHTVYYCPDDGNYFPRICQNTYKKYTAITGETAGKIELHPHGTFKKIVTRYKNLYMTGYTGTMQLLAPIKMSEFIYNTGLGEKNAQGFGFVQIKGND